MARYQFTPAASRALRAAAQWSTGDDAAVVTPAELLLGLLEESESRAAEMLAARGIDTAAVLARWPQLKAEGRRQKAETSDEGQTADFSMELQAALAAASARLSHFPRPFELATEHLLLGLAAAGDELGDWLMEKGLATEALTDQICQLYGYVAGNGDMEGSGSYTQRIPGVQGPELDACHDDSAGNALCGVPGIAGGLPDGALRSATEGVPYTDLGVRHEQTSLFRLLDAAANRAREGMRVLEDFVRFVWNDQHLTWQLKQLRHELAAAMARLSTADLLASRDTPADVGTSLTTAAEADRPDVPSVVTANAKRLQESLRSLEEYGKILSPQMSAQLEQLRYRSYTLERALSAALLGKARLAHARLYVLIDGRPSLDDFTQLVQTLVAAGVDVLQLRDKRLTDGELMTRAHRVRALTLGTHTLFIMNDRPDLAALAGADGVHVGQEELPVSACRAIVGPQALVGVSTHSIEQARKAVLDGANYIGVGPTFASDTKSFADEALRGPELLRTVHAEISLPAFAIGGIDLRNLESVLATGCSRIAVSGAVQSAADPGQAAQQFLARLAPTRPAS